MRKILMRAVTVMLIAVFLFSSYKIGSKLWEYYVGRNVYNDAAERSVAISNSNDTASAPASPVEESPIEVDFNELHSINPDVTAWIWSDFGINYPVMQSEDNDYYLRRMINREYNIVGSIFMDFRSRPDITSLNTIIYGHNMNDDSMFGVLTDYESQEFYESYPEMWLLTPNTDYKIELLCAFTCLPDDEAYTDFITEDELKDYLARTEEKSTFKTNFDITSVDKIVTFSTCSYEYTDARFVLIGCPVPVK